MTTTTYNRSLAIRRFLAQSQEAKTIDEILQHLRLNGDHGPSGSRYPFHQIVGSALCEMLTRGSVVRVSRGLYRVDDENLAEAM